MIQLPTVPAGQETFDEDLLVDADGLEELDRELGGDRAYITETGDLAHHLIEDGGDDATVQKSAAALEIGSDPEAADDALASFVAVKGKVHAAGIGVAAAEAGIGVVSFSHLRVSPAR
jgi:hypothetical protein